MLATLSRAGCAGRAALQRANISRSLSTSHTFEFPTPFKSHNCDGPESSCVATKDELMGYLDLMLRMRRMEIAFDNEYKARNIRGFCHLYDGQEACAVGVEAALTREDSWITSYRCHATMLARGGEVSAIAAELFGLEDGVAAGKGGSMHMYSKEENFYGGAGIVGAQVPCGVGLAFANKYNAGFKPPYNVSISGYGDGAANQGQIWEVANMAKLWGLPAIFLCENNQYGMGTSVDRHSSNPNYYTQGNLIPGVKADGMNVLAVRTAVEWCREFCSSGNGPIFLEVNTYRYHGHSMSDPGITYRDRDEVANTRSSRDPIENLKAMIQEAGFASAEEIKEIEKSVRKEVAAEIKKAKESSIPKPEAMYADIWLDNDGKPTTPDFIRGVETTTCLVNGKLGNSL